MSSQPTPTEVVQSAEVKAGVIEGTLATMHSQLEGMLPLNEATGEAPYESGLLGTLDHCIAMANTVQTRLVDLTEKVGLVRP